MSAASLNLTTPTEGPRAVERLRIWAETRLAGSGSPLHPEATATIGGRTSYLAAVSGGFGVDGAPIDFVISSQPSALGFVLICGDSDQPARTAVTESDCYPEADVPLALRGLEVTVREDDAPAGSVVGGTLLGEMPVSGVRDLDYWASDDESGIARVEALIGDRVAGTRDLSDRCAYADWAACPIADRNTLSVDTSTVPDGRYALRLRTIDAAGNQHDEHIQNIEVKNQVSPLPTGIGLTAPTSAHLTARFASNSRTSLIVPFGKRVRVRGRLLRAASGLAGAQVDVFERTAKAGARETSVGRALTRGDGTYSYTLAARRPSRTVRVAYGATGAPQLRVRVRAASTLKASLRGTTLRFSGRVLSQPLPPVGKRVILQGTAPGYAWDRFVTVRTDRRGRFAGLFRLAVRRPGVRLKVRVQVPAERGYPYLGYTGSPIALLVR